ncbi:MAG: hypothetical protein CM15mP68_1490 [Pseudomonadota bacterium]|nr:MAG: hypothetical protein CM15mP68_1490 [Pseudomonadota bacterium]
MAQLPAVSLAAVPGRRTKTIEIAQEIERRGFPGIFGPSLGDSLSLCNAIALSTTDIMGRSSITPILPATLLTSHKNPGSFMKYLTGAFVWCGRQSCPSLNRMGITAGKPLADMRQFVEDMQAGLALAIYRPSCSPPRETKRFNWPGRNSGGMVSPTAHARTWAIRWAI